MSTQRGALANALCGVEKRPVSHCQTWRSNSYNLVNIFYFSTTNYTNCTNCPHSAPTEQQHTSPVEQQTTTPQRCNKITAHWGNKQQRHFRAFIPLRHNNGRLASCKLATFLLLPNKGYLFSLCVYARTFMSFCFVPSP